MLTLRAVNRLRSGDVVLHDALVSAEVLALVPLSARVLNVGKRCGRKCITQQEINPLLVSFAAEGKLVVRLKSGDPCCSDAAERKLMHFVKRMLMSKSCLE